MKFPNVFGKSEIPEEPQIPPNKAENSPVVANQEKEKALKMLKDFEYKINELQKKRETLAKALDSGDKKQAEKITKEVAVLVKVAKKMQNAIEGKSERDDITAEYVYTDKNGNEKREEITIPFEKTLEDFKSFYEKHGIELDADFEEKIKGLWQDNIESIKKAIEEFGFKKMLVIPKNLPTPKKLDAIMTSGYEKEKGNKTYWGITSESITEDSSDRLVLVHDSIELDDNPLLKETLGKKAEELINKGERLNYSDYMILQRKIFEETGKHIDSKRWTWLPGSKSGSRVVHSCWYPDLGRVDVDADDADYSSDDLGCRLSRSFK